MSQETVDGQPQESSNLTPEEAANRMGWGPFTLPANHPFTLGAQLLHDKIYENYINGMATTDDLIKADKAYYSYMLSVADERKSESLRAQAHLFYWLITMFRNVVRMPGDGKLEFPD